MLFVWWICATVPTVQVVTIPHSHTLTGKEACPGWNQENAYFIQFEPECTFSSDSLGKLGISHKAHCRLLTGVPREHVCELQADLPALSRWHHCHPKMNKTTLLFPGKQLTVFVASEELWDFKSTTQLSRGDCLAHEVLGSVLCTRNQDEIWGESSSIGRAVPVSLGSELQDSKVCSDGSYGHINDCDCFDII